MIGLILDPAHGKDTPGKQSPDGSFKEWKWSRMILKEVFKKLLDMNYSGNIHSPYLTHDIEPGLYNRVNYYNKISDQYDKTYMVSLHVNAEPESTRGGIDKFGNAKGFEIWTSKGQDYSDKFATHIFDGFRMYYPEETFRTGYNWNGEIEKDLDKEANFTVLAGNKNVKPKYYGILIEYKFMTNKEDLADLQSDICNFDFTKILFKLIDEWMRYEKLF